MFVKALVYRVWCLNTRANASMLPNYYVKINFKHSVLFGNDLRVIRCLDLCSYVQERHRNIQDLLMIL